MNCCIRFSNPPRRIRNHAKFASCGNTIAAFRVFAHSLLQTGKHVQDPSGSIQKDEEASKWNSEIEQYSHAEWLHPSTRQFFFKEHRKTAGFQPQTIFRSLPKSLFIQTNKYTMKSPSPLLIIAISAIAMACWMSQEVFASAQEESVSKTDTIHIDDRHDGGDAEIISHLRSSRHLRRHGERGSSIINSRTDHRKERLPPNNNGNNVQNDSLDGNTIVVGAEDGEEDDFDYGDGCFGGETSRDRDDEDGEEEEGSVREDIIDEEPDQDGANNGPPPCINLKVVLNTDRFPCDITHSVRELTTASADGGSDYIWIEDEFEPYGTYFQNACVDPTKCWRYEIEDAFGDGLFGFANVVIYYDGIEQFRGRRIGFGGYRDFGSGCEGSL